MPQQREQAFFRLRLVIIGNDGWRAGWAGMADAGRSAERTREPETSRQRAMTRAIDPVVLVSASIPVDAVCFARASIELEKTSFSRVRLFCTVLVDTMYV